MPAPRSGAWPGSEGWTWRRSREAGPEGRITREDVLRAVGGAAPDAARTTVPPAEGQERIAVRGARRLIAEKMSRSWREIPHVTTFHTADATHVEALRDELTEESGTKVSALAVVVRALAQVRARDHPLLNSSWDAEAHEIVLHG